MTYAALGKLKKNSPEATLTAGIDDTTGTIPVDHLEYFHDEDGTLIVKGIVLGPDTSTITETEEITITGASGTTGAGNLTGGTRGVNADGTVGAAKAWDSGTVIKVTYTTGIHNQIADNFAKIKTTAAMSVYVDAAATGAADGTSWTDAFTTIQAAISSLPTIIAHEVTIYVRKGATPYGTLNTAIIISSLFAYGGSLTIRGEYYWVGTCAEASTASTTKFDVTAEDGANIAAGDIVVLSHGTGTNITDRNIKTTVASVLDKGSNVYEVTITDAYAANISTTDYYRIIKTQISGFFNCANTVVTITGFYFPETTSNYCVNAQNTIISLLYCAGASSSGRGVLTDGYCRLTLFGCYMMGSKGAVVVGDVYGHCILLISSSTGHNVNVINGGIVLQLGSTGYMRYVAYVGTGTAISLSYLSYAYISTSYIGSTYTTGIAASGNSVATRVSLSNNATTPLSPASSTDNPVII